MLRIKKNITNLFKKVAHYFKTLSTKGKIKWAVFAVLLIWFYLCLPKQLFNAPTSFVITDSNGGLLNASIAEDGQWRFPYNEDVPEKFDKCITTFEDKRFYYHPGVDPAAFSRALWRNISNKKTVSGGSTLTMQVIRMSKNNTKRNLWNKLAESIVAVRLECSYSKKSILALYASNAPFGSNVVGLDAAAWRYFGRKPSQLSWGEMAALAVLPNAPSLVHPGKNQNILLRKRNELLDKLQANNTIDSTTAYLAKQEQLPGEPKALPQLAPHLLDRFKKDYTAFGKSGRTTSTQTTISATLQQEVNDVLMRNHGQLKGNGINNAAAMVVEIETGDILSYVGNIYEPADKDGQTHVDILRSSRSPGSTLKPFLYAAMLSDGLLLPRQLIPDIPTQMGGYTPQNFNLEYDGAVPANRALARSLNIPAVRLLQQYKYGRFYDVLKNCGFTTLTKPADHYGMSLILGGCEVSPFELAGAYSSLARMYLHQQKNNGKWNSGDWFMPRYQTIDTYNKPAKDNTPAVFDYTSIWHTFNAMNEVMRPGEEGLWGLFSSAQKVAWKTGTSFGFRDGWAIGLTGKYCVVVWVGNATGEGRPDLTGINTAAPIMFDIFRLLPVSKWFEPPTSGFTYIAVCRQSGYKAGLDCDATDTVMVNEHAKVSVNCPYCRTIHLDKTATYSVNETCEAPENMVHKKWFVLPPTIEYYYKKNHAEYKALPDYKQGCSAEQQRVVDIIYPEENARIYIPKELTGDRGNTIFNAAHRDKNATLFWHLDNVFIGTTKQFHKMAVAPKIGSHTITVVDEKGESASRNFYILNEE